MQNGLNNMVWNIRDQRFEEARRWMLFCPDYIFTRAHRAELENPQ